MLAHLGVFTLAAHFCCQVCLGFHGWTCPEIYRSPLFWDFVVTSMMLFHNMFV